MFSPSVLWPFLLATVLLSLVPGPATALVIRSGATVGVLRTLPVIAGMEVGVYGWSLLAGAGIAGAVAASPSAFTALKIAGTLVLVYLAFIEVRKLPVRRTVKPRAIPLPAAED